MDGIAGLSLARILPALMLVGGGGVMINGGGKVGAEVMDAVKVVLTRYEMAGVAKQIKADKILGYRPPQNRQELHKHLKENMEAEFGRDPSNDLWEKPYELIKAGGVVMMLSTGPNGQIDRCANTSADEAFAKVEKAIAKRKKRAERAAREAAKAKEEGKEVPDYDPDDDYKRDREDDICIVLAKKGGRGKPGGGISERDSPFRAIRDR